MGSYRFIAVHRSYDISDKVLLTVPEAAERLGVGRSFLYGVIQRGELASVKLGRARRVPVAALASYVEWLQAAEEQSAYSPSPNWPATGI
ncbi:MAG: helix-turn-helix domain-containing protein [Dehalococcoidia bacterium]|nr:helix-turn-helix domain-containing protein [Dehalococcoidia bacterium]